MVTVPRVIREVLSSFFTLSFIVIALPLGAVLLAQSEGPIQMLAYARASDSLLLNDYARAWAGGTLRRGFLGLADVDVIAGSIKIHTRRRL